MMSRQYKLPDKQPDESSWDWCKRAAAAIPPEELVKMLLHMIHRKTRRKKIPLWSYVGEATDHGSGVSSAIVELYTPELNRD